MTNDPETTPTSAPSPPQAQAQLSHEDMRNETSPIPQPKPSPSSNATSSNIHGKTKQTVSTIHKKRVVTLLAVIAFVFILVLLNIMLKKEPEKKQVEEKSPNSGAVPEQFGNIAYNPLPPVKTVPLPATPQQQLAAKPQPVDPAVKEREEREKRRKDAMFAPSTIPFSAKTATKPGSAAATGQPQNSLAQATQSLNGLLASLPGASQANAATGSAGTGAATFDEGTSVGKSADQNKQGEKRQFLGDKSDLASTTNAHKLADQPSAYTVAAGTIVPAVLITGINSDLPGQIIAQVRENVFDTKTGQYLLIPQGARLLGKYDSVIAYGQDRALAVWQRMLLPNGKSIVLDQMQGVDMMGQSGYEDQVDRHMLRIVGTAILSTVFSLGADAAKSSWQKSDTFINSSSSSSGSSSSQTDPSQTIKDTANKLVDKNLNLQPTIKIRPGFSVNVLVNKDIIMEPYAYQ